MTKLLGVLIITGAVCWLGCGGDDGPNGPEPPTIVTVTAATAEASPDVDSVHDSIWNRITPVNVPMAVDQLAQASKRRPDNAQAVAAGVAVQALVARDSLFLRLAWDDDTWDCWPGQFEVTSFDILGSDTLPHFTRDDLSHKEDQLMVMFDGGETLGWDIWWWKVTTTGAGFLAQGANLTSTEPVVQSGDEIALRNEHPVSGQPEYMHPQGPANQSYRLLSQAAVTYDYNLAWEMGDLIPGYLIDGLKYLENASSRGNRWDIAAVSQHSEGEYIVVLRRALNTGQGTDMNMVGESTINVRIGITNNDDFLFNAGSTRQGFSNTFRLNLP